MNTELQEWWEIPDDLDTADFDFDWMPDVFDPPYIHQFGTQWQKTGGPRYVVGGATEKKYHSWQIAKKLPNKNNWIIPPDIDQDSFDWSWHPDDRDSPHIYQFGTQWQKTGGPRYPVKGARTVKYVDDQRATKLPTHKNWQISPQATVIDFDWSWHPDSTDGMINYVFGDDLSSCITYINTGYPQYKVMSHPRATVEYAPLDIFYLSNGEPCEEAHYRRLCEISGRSVSWVRGVNGREVAIKEAARQSSSPYFILFPAKVWADPHFTWDFQPTVYPIAQHYIFYAHNPVNGLLYGHQAAVCYNRELVLATTNWGLDFTMSAPHTVVPTPCGEARYNVTPHMTWRTAFREVVKLQSDPTSENKGRLETWLTVGNGPWGEWSIRGAKDGVEYWGSVAGDHDRLMDSFDWGWLAELWRDKYGER